MVEEFSNSNARLPGLEWRNERVKRRRSETEKIEKSAKKKREMVRARAGSGVREGQRKEGELENREKTGPGNWTRSWRWRGQEEGQRRKC